MEIEVTKINRLKDGKHTGRITNAELTENGGYEYVTLTIMSEDCKINVGFPANVNEKSDLGNLLMRYGVDLVAGECIDPEKLLVNQEVSFVTITKGDFANVVRESVAPKK